MTSMLFDSPERNKNKKTTNVARMEDPNAALEDSFTITEVDEQIQNYDNSGDGMNSSYNQQMPSPAAQSSVFRRTSAVAVAATSWERRQSAPLQGISEQHGGHHSFSGYPTDQEPRRMHSLTSAHDSANNTFDYQNQSINDYSDRGLGARPLGFQAVAQVRKLEKKERSTRLMMRNISNTSSTSQQQQGEQGGGGGNLLYINEQTPLTLASGIAAAVASSIVPEHEEVALGHHANFSGDSIINNSNNSLSSADQKFMLDSERESPWQVLMNIIFGKTVSFLLLLMPVAWWAHHREWSPAWVFWLNFGVLIPLATILSDFTEEVAAHTNQTLGGLINATFGNAVEVLVGIQALLSNEIRVVQASMLGSIFSNLLLVLGSCFFFGGLFYKEQRFNSTAATANMGLLALSSIALVLPTPFAEYYKVQDEHVLTISRVAAIFLIFMYLQLLVFQLKTHAHLFQDDDDSEVASIPMWVAIMGLLVATLLITMFSEFLVHSIDGFCESSGISRTFVGLIILPFVGNAVEHVAAVTVAMKDKMDLAMGGKHKCSARST
jgi:Ca2+:H+ antiporter